MRIFISYAHVDEQYASKIEEDIKNQNIGIWIDKKSIKPSSVWLKEIDDGLSTRQIDYVLGIVTNNYMRSTGGVEAYAKISEGLSKKDIKFIPLFFEDIDKIDSVIIKAISGYKFCDNYDGALLELIKYLKSEDGENASELLAKIEGEHSHNPFRRIRAEFFESDSSLAKAFAIPEQARYELVRGSTPLFIFGGRGSGKTMILKSLTPEVIASRHHIEYFRDAKSKDVSYFGLYLRLVRGSFSLANNDTILKLGFLSLQLPTPDRDAYKLLWEKLNDDIIDDPVLNAGINAAQRIFLNEINFKILAVLISKLKDLKNNSPKIEINVETEEKIVSRIAQQLNLEKKKMRTFNDLKKYLDGELYKIKDYLQKITLPYAGAPTVNWTTTSPDFLDSVCAVILDSLIDLKGTKVYLLLDEFENLWSYQQVIINEWIKTSSHFVVKVGVKFEGLINNMTLQGQQLQFKVGECDEISLDYNLFDDADLKQYQNLLKRICCNLLELEHYKEIDIEKLLDVPSTSELPQEIIIEEIKRVLGSKFDESKKDEYQKKFEVATIFRLLRQKEKVEGRKSRKKVYAGFDTFTYLSSGIIRVFLNLIGMAFYKAEDSGINVKKGQKISVDDQSWASRIVSKGYLERIHKNIEAYGGINGEIMYQFITDIGDIFRERLLFHLSEPETLSISISNPQCLQSFPNVKQLLCHGVKESMFYKREETSSYRPKQTTGVRTKDYVLNRVYSPALEISHRARWGRCHFQVQELDNLLNSEKRASTKKILQKRQRSEGKALTDNQSQTSLMEVQ